MAGQEKDECTDRYSWWAGEKNIELNILNSNENKYNRIKYI